ncbi:hypothetical protein C4D60_Mb05t02710 [Musa balbisiana]|uniref:YTH domain-containing family protein n=1 Tax=Musa balbisiana TaxID=52838 RepID=A0A4S8JT86_MUSBA|nr:hypothetical protein C4D60_Mb05t02710 [Musa balbisiana]
MAAVSPAPPADQSTDLMQKLSLDPKNEGNDASDVAKKVYLTSGYNGLMTEWEDYPRYANPDGAEVPPPGVYGDMYHHGYGYASYGPYPSPGSPIPTLGQNGQLYGSQHYHFPATYYQQPTPTSAPYTTAQTSGSIGEVSTSAAADVPPIPADTAKAISDGTTKASLNSNNGSAKTKPFSPCCSFDKGALPGGHPPAGFQDPRFVIDGMWSPVPYSDGSIFPDGQKRPPTTTACTTISHTGSTTSTINQNLRPLPHLMGIHGSRPATPGMVNKMYPNHRIYDHHANGYGSGQGFRSGMHDSRMNGRWGMSMDSKYKPRGRSNNFYGYGNENLDGMNELNKGPRSGHFRDKKGLGPTITLAFRGQSLPANVNSHDTDGVPEKDQYNKADFPETYSDAKFFIIKSYSEDDIHKSIKYSIWASTPHGNKKLDAAYQESKQKTSGCPVFLFFSVMNGKPVDSEEKDKEEAYRDAGFQKPSEVVTILKESGQGGLPPVEHVLSEKNSVAAAAGVAPKDVKPATEKQHAAIGVVDSC